MEARGWPLARAIGLAITVVASFAACREPKLGECPHYWSMAYDSIGADTNVAPLSGTIRDVPEYHDCQKLMTDPRSYGPLAAVFASQKLPSLVADLAAAPGMAIAAATVLGIDGGFAGLGIAEGGNCLYMWRRADGSWMAKMVPVPDKGRSCLTPVDPATAAGVVLSVATEAAAAPDSHPFVARFQYAANAHQIGLRCGDAWCTIGQNTPSAAMTLPDDAGLNAWLAALPGETPPDAPANPVTLAQLQSLARRPGWVDAQFLAPAGGGNSPTGLLGMVLPSPKLDAMTEDQFDNQWHVTGFVFIPASAPPQALAGYTERFHYASGWNALLLCRGAACVTGEALTCTSSSTGGEALWYARVTQRGGTSRTMCVVRRGHADVDAVPGTARWRWVKGDETVWEGCPRGCCEVRN